MKPIEAAQIADEIIQLYTAHGHAEYAGEKISQLEHMVQAARLAREQGHDDEVVLAAFLHDIGHIAEKLSDGMPWASMESKITKPLAPIFYLNADSPRG